MSKSLLNANTSLAKPSYSNANYIMFYHGVEGGTSPFELNVLLKAGQKCTKTYWSGFIPCREQRPGRNRDIIGLHYIVQHDKKFNILNELQELLKGKQRSGFEGREFMAKKQEAEVGNWFVARYYGAPDTTNKFKFVNFMRKVGLENGRGSIFTIREGMIDDKKRRFCEIGCYHSMFVNIAIVEHLFAGYNQLNHMYHWGHTESNTIIETDLHAIIDWYGRGESRANGEKWNPKAYYESIGAVLDEPVEDEPVEDEHVEDGEDDDDDDDDEDETESSVDETLNNAQQLSPSPAPSSPPSKKASVSANTIQLTTPKPSIPARTTSKPAEPVATQTKATKPTAKPADDELTLLEKQLDEAYAEQSAKEAMVQEAEAILKQAQEDVVEIDTKIGRLTRQLTQLKKKQAAEAKPAYNNVVNNMMASKDSSFLAKTRKNM